MAVNQLLKGRMAEAGFTQAELAEAVNAALRAAGYEGTVSDRTVRNWLTGNSRWPHQRQRAALESAFGRPVADLGFVPRQRESVREHNPALRGLMPRRRFIAASAGVALTAAATPTPALVGSSPSVGTSDVIRLRDRISALSAIDAKRGGHDALKRAALAGAAEALELQQRSTTQRVRARLFGLASDFTATAAWSLIDAGQLESADRHLDRALTLAGMAQDPEVTMRVWNLRSMLARQREHFGEAVAAGQAAQSTWAARRSRLHTSLAHARTAIGFARAGDRGAALRSLGRAEEAMANADGADPRPTWIVFYGPAELHSITAIVRDVVGEPAEAEAEAHRALAALPVNYRRNRAYITARLALAQLHQGEAEQACATTADVFQVMTGDPLPGRMRQLLGDFQRDLITDAPTQIAHEWADRYRSEWSYG